MRDANLSIRLSKDLKDRVFVAARRDYRSASELAAFLIELGIPALEEEIGIKGPTHKPSPPPRRR